MDELIAKLLARSDCKIVQRTSPPKKKLGEQGPVVMIDGVLVELAATHLQAPEELAIFRDRIESGFLFPPNQPTDAERINSWRIFPPGAWLNNTVNMHLVGDLESGGVDYLEKCFMLATSMRGADKIIAVDLNKERFGWIGYYWYAGDLHEGGYPVVAHSFSEWLERTLDAGPDVLYWERDDFVDMGPAIPGDPYYRPLKQWNPSKN